MGLLKLWYSPTTISHYHALLHKLTCGHTERAPMCHGMILSGSRPRQRPT